MDKNFKNEVMARPGGENLSLCYSCGSCTATCPVAELDDTFHPRVMIKKTLLGFKEEVLNNDDLWKCIQCRRCVSHCPQNVRFADIIRVLRDLSVEEGYYSEELLDEVSNFDKDLLNVRIQTVSDHINEGKDFDEVLNKVNSGGDKNG